MGDRVSTRSAVQEEIGSHPVNYTTGYLRRLIAERDYIRSALYNHGGSIITHGASLDLEGQDVYTSKIGNDYHLDLVEAERIIVSELNLPHRQALLAWADNVEDDIAAELMRIKPSALRKRRQRAAERVLESMGNVEQDARGSSGGTVEEVRTTDRDIAEETRDSG